MLTIASAANTSQGPATWLLDQTATGPFKPFDWNENVPLPELEKLKGKDCGSYAGFLHTDHAVRKEFFEGLNVPPRKDRPWAMDFSYIFDASSSDHRQFITGIPVSETNVMNELGHPTDWRVVSDEDNESEGMRSEEIANEIEQLLEECRMWKAAEA